MKRSPIPGLLLCLLLSLVLLFPCTPYGQELLQRYFPSVNLRESALLSSGSEDSRFPADSPPEADPPPDSPFLYYSVLREELPGEYVLVSLFTPGEEIPEESLTAMRRLGIPLSLTLQEDGSAELRVFDRTDSLLFDSDRMLADADGETLPFFYQEGRLTLLEDRSYLVFEKQP